MSVLFTLSPGWWEWHLGTWNILTLGFLQRLKGAMGSEKWWENFQVWENLLMYLESWNFYWKGQNSALKPTLCSMKDSLLSKWSEHLHLLTFSAGEHSTLQGSPFQVLKAVLHNTEPKTCLHVTSTLWFQHCSLMLCQINPIPLSQECLPLTPRYLESVISSPLRFSSLAPPAFLASFMCYDSKTFHSLSWSKRNWKCMGWATQGFLGRAIHKHTSVAGGCEELLQPLGPGQRVEEISEIRAFKLLGHLE